MKIPKNVIPFVSFLVIYFLGAEFICLWGTRLLEKSIEFSSLLYGGRPAPGIVEFVLSVVKISWLFPVAHLVIGLFLVRRFHGNEFSLKMYVDISFLLLFFYVVAIAFASAYAWAPFKLLKC